MACIRAPELPQDFSWLNTDQPLSLKSLRGRVVLLDFWTYGCINCLHILPDLRYLEAKYPEHLTVIGIHSAKFDHEKGIDPVRQSILRHDIHHPVLIDRDFQIWQQYVVKAWPTIMVIDPQGYVVGYVSGEGKREFLDDLIAKLIQKHDVKGTLEPQPLAWSMSPQLADRPLSFPGKVLADLDTDRLFIADTGHHRIVITTLSGQLRHIVGVGTPGLWDGQFDEAEFSAPQGMAFDRSHQVLYVADSNNHAIRKLDLVEQTVETIAGVGQQSQNIHPHGGKAREVALNSPWDLQLFRHFLLIAMAGMHQIWGLDLIDGQIGTLVGTGAEGCMDGDATLAAFAQPSGLALQANQLFVADSESSSIRSIELDSTPEVRTLCGSGQLFGFGNRDGRGESVRLQHCLGITAAHGLVWIADTYNHKIKRLNPKTGICQSIAGSGVAGWQDGSSKIAQFYEPNGLTVAGHWLFVADTNNHVIRRIDLDRLEVSTVVIANLCPPKLCFYRPDGIGMT
ncbi:MAG: redoxin domain-containing protein [Elainella sp. Prado103]|nr:redoxin domain-containing protein [Elainella sp. Prado103]